MKTIGIALLFGLCSLIGVRLGMRKTERLKTVRALRSDLIRFSEQIASGCGTLIELATKRNGPLFEAVGIYLDMLTEGRGEAEAAKHASDTLRGCETARSGTELFLTGLSSATRNDLLKRTQTLSLTLERAETEAETEAKKARVLRISGVLLGAGLAILLL